VALDLDTKDQFFRTFVALGSAVENLPSCLPMYGFDGTHSKNDKYRGVILTLLGRDGNGNNMTIALAVVHSENEKTFNGSLRTAMLLAFHLPRYPYSLIGVIFWGLQTS
jgi:hypothetical protein